MDRTPRKFTMTDFAASGTEHASGFTNRIRGEIIVQHKGFLEFPMQTVNHLLVITGTKRCNNKSLCFTACEKSRTVNAR